MQVLLPVEPQFEGRAILVGVEFYHADFIIFRSLKLKITELYRIITVLIIILPCPRGVKLWIEMGRLWRLIDKIIG